METTLQHILNLLQTPIFINYVATCNAKNSVVPTTSTTMPIQTENTPQIIQNTHSMVTLFNI